MKLFLFLYCLLYWSEAKPVKPVVIKNGLKCTLGVCELNEESLKFFVIGDWGGQVPKPPKYPFYHTINQLDNSRAMALMARNVSTQFQISVGDNFYSLGPKSISDPRFNATFERVYTDRSLQTPWYITAGNHDWYGNVSVQIEYTKLSERWVYPSYYYKVDYSLNSNIWVRLIMIDTVILCGNTDKSRPNIYPRDPYAPYEPANKTAAEIQWRWIEETLRQSEMTDYLFVVGHYPLYSAGEHGQTKCLVDRLEPLMHQHRVNAYFFGHSHSLEHLTRYRDNWTVHHILTGAGCSLDGSKTFIKDVPPAVLEFAYPPVGSRKNAEDTAGNTKNGGFVYVEVKQAATDIGFYQSQSGLLYSVPPIASRNLRNPSTKLPLP